MDIRRREGRFFLQHLIVISDAGDKQAPCSDLICDTLHGFFQSLAGKHMGQSIIHSDHNIIFLGKDIRKSAEIRLSEADFYLVFCRSLFCFLDFACAEIGSCYGIPERGEPYCLRPDSAGAVKNPGRGIKTVPFKDLTQKYCLFLHGSLPVKIKLVILGRHAVIK